MLEKLIKKLKGTTPIAKCVWKSVYEHSVANKMNMDDLRADYKMIPENCSACSGYENIRGCYYVKK